MIYSKKLKPTLIDQNIIGEYMKEKMMNQMVVSGAQTNTELQKLSTKIFYNVINFIYHYFFIIGIFLAIGYYLYKRYVWYQDIKKTQAIQQVQQEKEEQMKKYFDNIMEGKEQETQIQPKPKLQPQPHPHIVIKSQPQLPVYSNPYFIPGKKLDKVISGNNGYLNHMKQGFDTTISYTPSMGRIQPTSELTTKTVRFAQGDFDAYGRNNLNPKTGETLVKQIPNPINPDYNHQPQIDPYDSKVGYSSAF